MKTVLTTLNAKYIHSSLAVHGLAAYCESRGIAVLRREYTINQDVRDILADLYLADADVIGFACYIWNISLVLELTEMLRKVRPKTLIVLGGPEVSYDPAEVLQREPAVDCVVMGEGEVPLASLLAAHAKEELFQGIPGVAWRNEGEIVVQGGRQVAEHFSFLPFPYEGQLADLADRILYYETSRGCPFSCGYCLSGEAGGVRYGELDQVKKELAFLVERKVRQVKFVDRTFNARKSHYFPLWQFLAALPDCHTNFHFEIAVDWLDEDVLKFLAQVPAGRFQFEIGIQSTHEPTLAACGRKNHWDRIVRNVEALQRAGNIHLHLDLIAGLPHEGMEEFQQSFRDVYRLQPDMLQLGFLKLLKGSAIRRDGEKYGYKAMEKAPYEILENNFISYGELRRLKVVEELLELLYNNGRFRMTTNWLANELYGGNSFLLYDELAAEWEKRRRGMGAVQWKSMFAYITEFLANRYLSHLDTGREFLKLDALLCPEGTVRPEGLSWNGEKWREEWNGFWRSELCVQKYIEGYQFKTWREIQKRYHIEVCGDLICQVLGFYGETRESPLLFVYGGEKVQVIELAWEDFLQGEKE